MTKHPRSRADRRRLAKKDKFEYSKDRAGHVERQLRQEAIEQKEALNGLRKQVLAVEAEERES